MANQEATTSMYKTVFITRVLHASVRKAWEAWAEPEQFKKWWGPKDYTCPSASIDFKVGGRYLAAMKGPDEKEVWSTGVYKEIDPLKKIVCSDNFSDDKGNKVPASHYGIPGTWPDDVIISVSFEEIGKSTKMTMQQEGIPEAMYDDCVTGWQQSFDKMESSLKES
jgi:uncharacterized protein YndB with AHSA1/START domain